VTSASVPSVRSLFVCANVRSKLREKVASARAVAWWTIASGGLQHRPVHGRAVQ
jgi:hypothetical protein